MNFKDNTHKCTEYAKKILDLKFYTTEIIV